MSIAKSDKTEVIFFSTSKSHMVSYKPETRFPDGRVKDPPQNICFHDYEYRTDVPSVIEFIKELKSFRMGKIKIVSEKELHALRMARMPVARDLQVSSGPVKEKQEIVPEEII